jgi:hypothetical protein
MLSRRIALLADISALASSLDMGDDVAYTCENAGHFFLNHVLARWEKFLLACKPAKAQFGSQVFSTSSLSSFNLEAKSNTSASKPAATTAAVSVSAPVADAASSDDEEMPEESKDAEPIEPEAEVPDVVEPEPEIMYLLSLSVFNLFTLYMYSLIYRLFSSCCLYFFLLFLLPLFYFTFSYLSQLFFLIYLCAYLIIVYLFVS